MSAAVDRARNTIRQAEETYRQTIESYRSAGVAGEDLAREELRAARARDDAIAPARSILQREGASLETTPSAPAQQPAQSSGTAAGPAPGASASPTNPSPAPTASAPTPSRPQSQARSGSNGYLDRVLEPFRVRGIEWDIQDNELNQYDRYAYHWRLLMVNEVAARGPRSSGGQAAPANLLQQIANGTIPTVVIAESGVTTGFNITSVQILDSVGHNFRTQNTVTTEIDITITEPYGMTLIDRMFLAGRQLGLLNWRMAPMILDLSFRLIDNEGFTISSEAEPIRKLYKLVLIDTESSLTEVGSTYRIKASAEGNIGYKDFWFVIPQTHRVIAGSQTSSTAGSETAQNNTTNRTGANNAPPQLNGRTVGAFFQDLGQKLTQFYRDQRNNLQAQAVNTTPIIEYTFVVAPALAEKQLNINPRTNARGAGFSVGGANNQEIVVSRGVSISALIDDVCCSLEDVDFFVPPNSTTTGQIRVPRIECTVELIGFDSVLNDYVRRLNYVISVVETMRPTPTVEHGQRFQLSLENQTSRARHTATQKSVRKFYPFQYTGMNTEVIKLDLTFNQLHIIGLPFHNGATLTPARLGSSQTISQEVENLRASLRDIQSTRRELAQLDALVDVANRQPNLASLRPSGPTSALEIDLRNQANEIVSQLPTNRQTPLARRQALSEAVALRRRAITDTEALLTENLRREEERFRALLSGGIILFDGNNEGADPRALQQAQQAEQQRNQASARRERTFAEDIAINSYSNNIGLYSYAADPKDIQNTQARSATTADDANGVRGVYTTILAQLYDRQGQHLVEIELEIRGDPYWLGLSNVERDSQLLDYVQGLARGQNGISASFGNSDQNSRYANYYDRDASFLLLFRPGDQPNQETGYMDFKDSVFFNGIYHTIEVTHMFSNGQFTQKLRAVRDLININAVRDAPQTAAVTQTASTTATTPSGATTARQTASSGPTGPVQPTQLFSYSPQQLGIERPNYRNPNIDSRGRWILPPFGE